MRIGVHLPQFGRAVARGGVQRAARDAEAQGFDDIWVSDHLVVPADAKYPPARMLDPLIALTAAAAVTERVGLGTSVLVAPQYCSPLQLANTLASLDAMSGGRVIAGFGVGWAEREYQALGAPFRDRGARLDEILRLCRTVWEQDPAHFTGQFYPSFDQIRVLPAPDRRIPVWIGGASDAAVERALKHDGYHAMDLTPIAARECVERVRSRRPDNDFTVSVRITWNVAEVSAADVAGQLTEYQATGVDAMLVCPDRGDLDAWLGHQEALAEAVRRSL